MPIFLIINYSSYLFSVALIGNQLQFSLATTAGNYTLINHLKLDKKLNTKSANEIGTYWMQTQNINIIPNSPKNVSYINSINSTITTINNLIYDPGANNLHVLIRRNNTLNSAVNDINRHENLTKLYILQTTGLRINGSPLFEANNVTEPIVSLTHEGNFTTKTPEINTTPDTTTAFSKLNIISSPLPASFTNFFKNNTEIDAMIQKITKSSTLFHSENPKTTEFLNNTETKSVSPLLSAFSDYTTKLETKKMNDLEFQNSTNVSDPLPNNTSTHPSNILSQTPITMKKTPNIELITTSSFDQTNVPSTSSTEKSSTEIESNKNISESTITLDTSVTLNHVKPTTRSLDQNGLTRTSTYDTSTLLYDYSLNFTNQNKLKFRKSTGSTQFINENFKTYSILPVSKSQTKAIIGSSPIKESKTGHTRYLNPMKRKLIFKVSSNEAFQNTTTVPITISETTVHPTLTVTKEKPETSSANEHGTTTSGRVTDKLESNSSNTEGNKKQNNLSEYKFILI